MFDFFFFFYSLRVNLDMGKMVFSWMIKKDSKIPGTVVRASTIPEQLGRISYLLTDKTGENLAELRYQYQAQYVVQILSPDLVTIS